MASRAERRRTARAEGVRRSASKAGRRPAHRLPPINSRSDVTRKHVLGAIAEARRTGHVGDTATEVLRIGEARGTPFSRGSLHRYGDGAFRRTPSGRLALESSDTIQRRADIVTVNGRVERERIVRGSRDASKVARWQNAAKAYLRDGDEGPLRALSDADRTIDRGRTVLTGDPDVLQRLADEDGLDDFRTEAGS